MRARDEHSSPRIVLLCRQAWRHQLGSAEHALRHPAARGQQPDTAAGGRPRGEIVRAAALQAHDGRGGAARLRATVF